jgi:transglutaminase-like putative cysteine protease
MIYRIVHRTTYKYKYPVSVGNHVSCLKPRSLLHHHLAHSELRIQPLPVTRTERVDYFGNGLCFFTVQEPHKELVVEARSEVILDGNATPWPQQSLPWEEAARSLPNDRTPAGLEAYQFVFESPRIRIRPSLPHTRSSRLDPDVP